MCVAFYTVPGYWNLRQLSSWRHTAFYVKWARLHKNITTNKIVYVRDFFFARAFLCYLITWKHTQLETSYFRFYCFNFLSYVKFLNRISELYYTLLRFLSGIGSKLQQIGYDQVPVKEISICLHLVTFTYLNVYT